MKKILTLLMITYMAGAAHAQSTDTSTAQADTLKLEISTSESTEGDDQDTTRIKLKKMKILIISDREADEEQPKVKDTITPEKNDFIHWSGFDLFVSGYDLYEVPAQTEAYYRDPRMERSVGFNINVLEKGVRLVKNNVILATGLGMQFTSYAFNRDTVNWAHTAPSFHTVNAIRGATITDVREAINLWYVQAPLLLQFNTGKNPEKSFHLAAGLVGGVKISARYKTKTENRSNWKSKVRFEDVNPVNISATVRAGYGNFTVFASYGLLRLDQSLLIFTPKDTFLEPGLHSFSAGITLLGF